MPLIIQPHRSSLPSPSRDLQLVPEKLRANWPDSALFELPNPLTSPFTNPGSATYADWLALPDDSGAELINGRIEYQSFPSLDHGRIQRKLGRLLDPFDRKPGNRYPGGWWIGCEVDVIVGGHGVRPDLVGWRRDLHPQKPRPGPTGVIEARPDWIGEVVSPSSVKRDYLEKGFIYMNAGVPYYWVVDPGPRSMLVIDKHDGCVWVDGGPARVTFRPKPFDSIELHIGSLFDDDDDE